MDYERILKPIYLTGIWNLFNKISPIAFDTISRQILVPRFTKRCLNVYLGFAVTRRLEQYMCSHG